MSDFPLFAARLDDSVVALGDDFDLFGHSDFGGLVADRSALDASGGSLAAVLFKDGKWYSGKLAVVRSTDDAGNATDSLWPLGHVVEIPPGDALAWIVRQFGYVPPKAAELFSAATEPPPEAPAVAPPVEPHEVPPVAPVVDRQPEGEPPAEMKEPDKRAFKAYKAVRVLGMKQADAVKQLKVSQSTISRWVAHVVQWLEGGNVLPPELAADLNAKPARPKQTPMDPRTLEQGPRLNKRRA